MDTDSHKIDLTELLQFPTVKGNVHESIYRSFHILKYVLMMIDRGDSKQTIFEVVKFLLEYDEPAN